QALRNESIEFWMVGPRQCRPPEQLRRLKNVRWFGRVAQANAAQYYRDADIFILPTLSDGFAMTQLEAQAHGLPVIASEFCGKVVDNGRNGIVLEEPTAACIAAAVRDCLADADRLRKLAAASRLRAEFTIEALAEQLQKVGA